MARDFYKFITGLLMIAFLACFSGVASADESPETTVKAYFNHLNKAEYSQAKALYTKAALQVLDGLASGEYESWGRKETKRGTIRDVKIVKSKLLGEGAEVTYQLTFKDGSMSKKTVSLSSEDGSWKMGLIP